MRDNLHKNIVTVDCHYIRETLAASYLVRGKNENVIIETGHPGAVPHILAEMQTNQIPPDSISLIFVTHVHLDHCGGLGGLLEKCRNASVVCHPRARPHLVDPKRLIKGSMAVYGEPLYNSLYGTIHPIDDEKIKTVEDGEVIKLDNLSFRILHTAGHARHHICIFEETSGTVFTGDTFGVAYPDLQLGTRKFIYPATTPSDFDIPEARKSIQRILDLKAESAWLVHFGNWQDIPDGATQLLYALDEIENIQSRAQTEDMTGESLQKYCYEQLKIFIHGELKSRGIFLSPEQSKIFDYDIKMNALGISYAIDKQRRELNRG